VATIGAVLGIAALIVLSEVIRYWVYRKLYVDGRSIEEQGRSGAYQAVGIGFVLIMLVSKTPAGAHAGLNAWTFLFWGSFGGAMYCAVRGTQRSSNRRTILAFAAFVVGTAALFWALFLLGFRNLRQGVAFTPAFAVAIAVLGCCLYVAAVRLARR